MKMHIPLTLVALLPFILFANALRECPANCRDKMCSDLGCVLCAQGFYLYMDQDSGKSICIRSCPDGYYSNPLDWCEQCETTNCVKCSDEYTCTECETGYHVNKDGDCIFTAYISNE